MIPVRDALIAGVLPGAIATAALSSAALAIVLRRKARPSAGDPATTSLPLCPSGLTERGIAFVATLLVGAGIVLSMRLLEPYSGWWPVGINDRTPALVGFGAIAAAIVAAGPARWWFALPVCVVAGGAISFGVREALGGAGSLPLDITLDALAIGLPAFSLGFLVDRASVVDRGRLARPLPVVALVFALGPAAVAIFDTGTSVSARQFGVVPAVLMSAAIVLAVFHNSSGRVVLRGVGVLVAMAIGVWLLVGRTIGSPGLTVLALVLVLLSAVGAGVAAVLATKFKRWWMPALVTLVIIGVPMGAAAYAQHLAANPGDDSGGSPADFGY